MPLGSSLENSYHMWRNMLRICPKSRKTLSIIWIRSFMFQTLVQRRHSVIAGIVMQKWKHFILQTLYENSHDLLSSHNKHFIINITLQLQVNTYSITQNNYAVKVESCRILQYWCYSIGELKYKTNTKMIRSCYSGSQLSSFSKCITLIM